MTTELPHQRSATTTRRGIGRGALASTGVLALAAAGCRPGESPGLPFAGPKVVRVATFLGQDPTMITGAERAPVELQRAANAINQQKPGYEIRVDFMLLPPRPTAAPPGQSGQAGPTPTAFAPSAASLEAAASGGDLAAGNPPPDLALISTPGDLPALLEKKLVQPLDEVLKADRSLTLDEFVPGALEAVRTRGRVGMLPLAGQVNTLLYDSGLFETAGVKLPDREWTWSAALEAARRITRESPEARYWGLLAHNQVPLLLSLIWAHGGELLAKDAKRSLLSEPAAREGIQFWADLLLRHRVAPIPPPNTQMVQLQSVTESGLATIEGGALGIAGAASAVRVTATVDRQGAAVQGPAQPGSRERAAMMLSNTLTPLLGNVGGPRRTVLTADVPKARSRATLLSLSAGLALGARAQDQRLAMRAAMALADRLQQASISTFGFPVRKPDPALLRRAQPQLTEEDAVAVAEAMTYSRAFAPELAPQITATLQNRLMGPILTNQGGVDEAIRSTAAALDDLLRG